MAALSDSQMQHQINHMVKFIEKEGQEKAEEIDTKAGEDFNIEKVRLVQAEKKKLMTLHERKAKQAEVAKKIEASNQLNLARLRILKAQDDHLKAIYKQTWDKMIALTKDKSKYDGLLKALMTQAFLGLMETDIHVRCRQCDVAAVEGQIAAAKAEYTKITKVEIKVTMDKVNYLGDECGGGVEAYVDHGRIKVTNTLDTRLETACEQILPAIRNQLFGIGNGTRAFFN